MWFRADAPVETAVHYRDRLESGDQIVGPAVVEQFDATTPVYPGDEAEVDAAGNLIIALLPGGE